MPPYTLSAKSLRTLVTSGHYPDIRFGVKFYEGNIGSSEHAYSFPHLLKRCG